GDFATYRGTAAAAAVGTDMRRPIFMHQRQPTGGVRPNATQNGQTDPRTPCRSLLCRKSPLSRVGISRQSRKSLQFAPLPSSSGESRVKWLKFSEATAKNCGELQGHCNFKSRTLKRTNAKESEFGGSFIGTETPHLARRGNT